MFDYSKFLFENIMKDIRFTAFPLWVWEGYSGDRQVDRKEKPIIFGWMWKFNDVLIFLWENRIYVESRWLLLIQINTFLITISEFFSQGKSYQ